MERYCPEDYSNRNPDLSIEVPDTTMRHGLDTAAGGFAVQRFVLEGVVRYEQVDDDHCRHTAPAIVVAQFVRNISQRRKARKEKDEIVPPLQSLRLNEKKNPQTEPVPRLCK